MTGGLRQTRYGNVKNARSVSFIELKQEKQKLKSCQGGIVAPA